MRATEDNIYVNRRGNDKLTLAYQKLSGKRTVAGQNSENLFIFGTVGERPLRSKLSGEITEAMRI